MQAFKSILILALPLLAIASPLAPRTDPSTCNSGSLQCCNSSTTNTNSGVTSMLGLLGVSGNLVGGLVGLQCDPISAVVGLSGNKCTQQTLCCSGNTYNNNLIVLGCSPTTVST